MSEVVLKPCPFCGEVPEVARVASGYRGNADAATATFQVRCECCGNFLKPETVWFLAEDAVPTNCRRLLTECKQLTESEVDDGKERGAGYEKPADEERHDERASRPGSGNPGADGVF